MFQPLLDAFIESASIEKMASKSPPLKIAVANWWGDKEIEEFKKNILYFILSQRYTITLHRNPD
ncbi:fucosyltransferase, partial [Helicobacter pylori]